MSILIKGMDKPTDCGLCPFEDFGYCNVKGERNTSESGIDTDCPLIEVAERKTENSSEIPNNCEHITEDGVTCAKYPACDDCLDNPLNKVKGSERLVKGKDEPTISKMEQVDKDINVRSKEKRVMDLIRREDAIQAIKEYLDLCCLTEAKFHKGFEDYNDEIAREIISVCVYEPKDEPKTQMKTQNSNLTFKTLEYCDICDHKGCKECIANALDEHCIPSQFKKQIEDECAKEYEELGLKELKELIEADRKTENSSEIPNNSKEGE